MWTSHENGKQCDNIQLNQNEKSSLEWFSFHTRNIHHTLFRWKLTTVSGMNI